MMRRAVFALGIALLIGATISSPMSDKTLFISTEQTGSGAVQSVAHGLGVAPSRAFISLTGGPFPAYKQPIITEGVHTATNVVVTVTLGWKYRIIALP